MSESPALRCAGAVASLGRACVATRMVWTWTGTGLGIAGVATAGSWSSASNVLVRLARPPCFAERSGRGDWELLVPLDSSPTPFGTKGVGVFFSRRDILICGKYTKRFPVSAWSAIVIFDQAARSSGNLSC